jgi:hypothetical protein
LTDVAQISVPFRQLAITLIEGLSVIAFTTTSRSLDNRYREEGLADCLLLLLGSRALLFCPSVFETRTAVELLGIPSVSRIVHPNLVYFGVSLSAFQNWSKATALTFFRRSW